MSIDIEKVKELLGGMIDKKLKERFKLMGVHLKAVMENQRYVLQATSILAFKDKNYNKYGCIEIPSELENKIAYCPVCGIKEGEEGISAYCWVGFVVRGLEEMDQKRYSEELLVSEGEMMKVINQGVVI